MKGWQGSSPHFLQSEGVRFNLISTPLFLNIERDFQAVAGGKVIIFVLHSV